MEELLDYIIEILMPQSDFVLYMFLLVSAILENIIPPIPGDTITAFGAFLAGSGRLGYVQVFLITTAGSVIGFMTLFYFGRKLERQHFIERDYRFFSAASIVKAENWFRRYGYFVVLINRFIPGIRSVVSLVSGISGLKPAYVLIVSTISASIWNLIWIQGGFLIGSEWKLIKQKVNSVLESYSYFFIIFAASLFALFVVYRMIRFFLNRNFSRKNK